MSTLKEPQAGKGQTRAEARMIAIGVANNTSNNIRYIYKNAHGQKREDNEDYVRGVWHNIIETAIDTPANEQAQDRLVQEIVRAQKLRAKGRDRDYMPADGGLHLFAGYLSEAWLNRLMLLKTWERLNLAAFTARLVVAGVDAPDVVYCAVYVLGETLETRIPLQLTKNDKNDASVANLLPAAVAWFKFAGHKLALFSNGEEKILGGQGRLAAVGQLARDAGVKPGFSTKRWHFWYKQLRKLSSADNKGVSEQARQGLESMDLWNDWVG